MFDLHLLSIKRNKDELNYLIRRTIFFLSDQFQTYTGFISSTNKSSVIKKRLSKQIVGQKQSIIDSKTAQFAFSFHFFRRR